MQRKYPAWISALLVVLVSMSACDKQPNSDPSPETLVEVNEQLPLDQKAVEVDDGKGEAQESEQAASEAESPISWTSVEVVDEFSDEKSAFVTFEDNSHILQLQRVFSEDGQDQGVYLTIKRKLAGQFAPTRSVDIRVDDNPVAPDFVELADIHKETMELVGQSYMPRYVWQPKVLFLRIGDKAEKYESGNCSFLAYLANGDTLKMRYFVSDQEQETFSFPLKGIREAMLAALSVEDIDC